MSGHHLKKFLPSTAFVGRFLSAGSGRVVSRNVILLERMLYDVQSRLEVTTELERLLALKKFQQQAQKLLDQRSLMVGREGDFFARAMQLTEGKEKLVRQLEAFVARDADELREIDSEIEKHIDLFPSVDQSPKPQAPVAVTLAPACSEEPTLSEDEMPQFSHYTGPAGC